MKSLFVLVAWCLLFVLSWPLALLVLILWPLVWLLLIPFRLASIALESAFGLAHAILSLPARLLGFRGRPVDRAR